MELSSPENGFEELNDILKDNEPCAVDELHPSCIVNEEQNSGEYAFGNLATNNDFCGEHEHNSLSKDFSYYEFRASPQQLFSPLQTGFSDNVILSDAQFVDDDERVLSSPKQYYQQREAEDLCSDYLSRSSFKVEVESIHNNMDAEVSEQIMESSLKKDVTEEQEMEDRLASTSNERMVHESFISMSTYESTKSGLVNGEAEDEVSDIPTEKLLFSVRSPIENDGTGSEQIHNVEHSSADFRIPDIVRTDQYSPNRSLQVPISPNQARQMSFTHDISPCAYLSPVSPKTTASPQHIHELYSSKVHRPKHPSSPEDSDHSIPPYDNKNHASPRMSQQGERCSARHLSASPRNHHSHRYHRRQKRLVSKSPSRQKEPSSLHRRDHRERSRSRSPHRRHYHRRPRSPRRRYSPSHRSPPSAYHSHHRSPKRRHWSPPHNRSTGLGKPGRNLFVAGFSFLTTERDLERKFSRFGRVRNVRIVRNKRSGESRGFAFLTLERDEEADAAIRALDKTEWNSRIVLVEKSKPHS